VLVVHSICTALFLNVANFELVSEEKMCILSQRLARKRKIKKIPKPVEMFGNKSIRDISKVSAKIFFGVDKSLKFAA